MIKARIAADNKVCLVFDASQTGEWERAGKVNGEGIAHILRLFTAQGIPLTSISAVCLCDVYQKGKASDYKAKKEYIDEVFATMGFNVLVPVGAEAFAKIVGFKGQQKYLKQALVSEVYGGQKVIPLQNPLQAKYDPSVMDVINETIALIKEECEFPDFRAKDRLPTNYQIIDTMEKFKCFIEFFMTFPEFAYDLETTGLMFNRDEITTIQFSHKPGFAFLIPCNTVGEWPAAPNFWTAIEWEYIKERLRELFARKDVKIIGHHKKFDDKFIFHHWGIPLQKEQSWDTMIAAFLCDENSPNGLKELACKHTDLGDYEQGLERFKDDYCKKHKVLKKASTKNPNKPFFSYGMVPFDILAPYALADADATIRLYHFFKDELLKEEQEEPFKIVMRITWLLTRFELNGWPVNEKYGYELKAKWEKEIEELRAELLQEPLILQAAKRCGKLELEKENKKRKNKLTELPTPFEFNLNSGPQKAVLFFDVMKLKTVKLTKKGNPATDKESVATWSRTVPKHKEFLQKLTYYAELTKFLSTYVMGILSKTVNGRVHPTYNATGAKTGRTSSREPNFQNLPARGDHRKMKLVKAIKAMIEAPEGRLLGGADLSAIEMVWAAIVSGDRKLIQIFNDHGLIHESIAKELFPYITCPLDQVKKMYEFERNSVSKTVQFLSIYGGGPDALMRKVNESILERQDKAKAEGKEALEIEEYTLTMAEEILANYFKKYGGVDRYIKATSFFIEENGYAKSHYGFKRRVPAVRSDDKGIRSGAIRQGVNATIQNPASIFLLLAICNYQEEIDEMGWDILLIGSVHDASYQDMHEELKILARDRLLYWMTQPPFPDCPVPIRAEAEWGKNWSKFTDDFGAALVDQEEEDEEDEVEEAA